uniref:NACHT and WD repeat domain-containing protein 1-like n=1 Tax=Saccoglossus kowalevskii TaxID=10224 RepID=A0ABM0MMI5_SACKO|nr:PREDICTED: NACHT and WD repeat domain-containing protein 1-like [Saccoglossus kowalevskii]
MAARREDDIRKQLLEGWIFDLPPEPSNIVRIYLSSTFEDYVAERNILLEDAYPVLLQWCQRRGLDFQVVDMRWGIPRETTIDHNTVAICQREIQTCQQMSAGPNFVCLVGQRYGYRPLPTEIIEQEFDNLQKCVYKHDDKKLLSEWYRKDKNAIPPKYLLQPITIKYDHYYDNDQGNQILKEKDHNAWLETSKTLKNILKKSASLAMEEGIIDEDTKHKYYMSVTELEIRAATSIPDINQHCICFMRKLDKIKEDSEMAERYMDVEENHNKDEESRTLLENVKNQYIPSRFTGTRHCYNVEWQTIRYHKPLVIFGVSGIGKTSVMSKLVMDSRSQFGNNCVTVFRFLGISTDSSSIMQHASDDPRGRPLVIMLDSLDQLSESHSSFSCHWLPKTCPPNVTIVVSVLPNVNNILEHLVQSMPDDTNYFPVKSLDEESGNEIFETWMSRISRKVTRKQKQFFKKGDTIRSAIAKLYERLEIEHGHLLVSHALAYITGARHGLTEAELEDILSIDDEVLDDVYQHWSPPNPHVVRIPPILLARLKYDLQEYLVNRHSDGKTVMVLYHRQFIETARNKYLHSDGKQDRHQVMAEFFLGKWSNGTRKRKETLNADRKVSSQPLRFHRVYNLRKLQELPYHLLYAGNDDELIEHTIGNFDFVNAVVCGTSVQSMLEHLDLIVKNKNGSELYEEVDLIRGALRLAKSTLEFTGGNKYSRSLAVEMLGRLLHLKDKYPRCIGRLVRGAQNWADRLKHSILIPQRGCFPLPGGHLRTTLIGHQGEILDIAVNQSRMLLVTASCDCTLKIWDLETAEVVHTLNTHSEAVYCVAISGDGKWLVSGSSNDTLIIWNLLTGELVHKLPENHRNYYLYAPLTTTHYSCMVVSVDAVAICVYDMVNGRRIHTLSGHTEAVSHLKITPDDLSIVSTSDDSTVKIWCVNSGQLLHDIQEHNDYISCLAVSQKYTVSCDAMVSDQSIIVIFQKVIDTTNGKIVHSLQHEKYQVTSVCISPDESYLTTGCGYHLLIWNLGNGQLLHKCSGHDSVIDCICITMDNKYIVSGARDGIMVVWELETGQLVHTLEGQQAIISHLALVEYMVVSASLKSQYIKLWNISPEQANEKHMYSDKSGIVALTTNCQYVVHVANNGTDVKAWDVGDGKDANTLTGHIDNISCLATTSDDQYCVSGSQDKTARLWHVKSGECMYTFQGHPAAVKYLSINYMNSHFVCASADNTLTLWDMTAKTRDHSTVAIKHITCIAVTNKNVIFYGTNCSMICVYYPKTANTQTLKGHKSSIQCVVLSNDSQLMASVAKDMYIMIWNVERRKKLHMLHMKGAEFNRDVRHLAFSDDNSFLASAATDKAIHLWKTEDGRHITSQYVYSNVTTMKIKYNHIIGGTCNGQLVMLNIHYVQHESDDMSEVDLSEFGSSVFRGSGQRSVCCSIM